jgi:DNA mismatch repair protein MutL
MGKINVLSFEIANLIAAGEVVERPSSVLKELIENSIDAGATRIVAEIKRGGVALIRVSDNGCGIDKDDLPVSLKRHATSKISERDDLDKIMTLGFRGEALAAISSVSEVTIITKTKDAPIGYMLTSEGGRAIDISEVGASDGTTVVVENLFFNVPARRKFLKKDSTEAMNVAALVEKVALSRPDISIQLLIDGEEKFKTLGDGELLGAIRSIYGRDFASKLIHAEGVSDGIKVSGYIGRSDNVRKNRNLENIFINGRYVKSLTAQAALEKAYTSYIAGECFPCCALFIEMNPGTVDVNVHPAKLEVKFSDERKVFEAVYYTVKTALEEHEYRPEMSLGAKKSDYNPVSAFVPIGADTKGEQIKMTSFEPSRTAFNKSESYSRESDLPKREYGTTYNSSQRSTYVDIDKPLYVNSVNNGIKSSREELTPNDSIKLLERYKNASVAKAEPDEQIPVKAPEAELEYKYVGEAFDCYLFVEYEGAILVIDKHAAHERVIFEDLKQSRNQDGRVSSQGLLLPLTVILTPDELAAANEYKADFDAVGFEFSLNERSVDVTAIPDSISPSDAEELFVNMLREIVSGVGNPENSEDIRREKALYSIACKAAIKGGRVYDKAVIEWLIQKVLSLPDITVCPHGRPIAYKLKKSELDRQFDRIK